MAIRNDAGKSFVKNTADFHPSRSSLRHHGVTPAATTVAGMDASNDPRLGLMKQTTKNLRIRARSLAIPEYESMERQDLLSALLDYHYKHFEERKLGG